MYEPLSGSCFWSLSSNTVISFIASLKWWLSLYYYCYCYPPPSSLSLTHTLCQNQFSLLLIFAASFLSLSLSLSLSLILSFSLFDSFFLSLKFFLSSSMYLSLYLYLYLSHYVFLSFSCVIYSVYPFHACLLSFYFKVTRDCGCGTAMSKLASPRGVPISQRMTSEVSKWTLGDSQLMR